MLRKLFPFLFKSKPKADTPTATKRPASGKGSERTTDPSPIVAFGLIARNHNHRGLRKGTKIYVRQIFDDGERLRVRGIAPNGKKVTLSVHRRSLKDYESEGVPEHLTKHYSPHSLFQEEHEAKMKAEALNKR
jgi:hypothetical protein